MPQMRAPLAYLCKYHQHKNSKEELKSDIVILSNPNDDELSSDDHSYNSEEDDPDFHFENKMTYDVMTN